jgi:hypothetical protein
VKDNSLYSADKYLALGSRLCRRDKIIRRSGFHNIAKGTSIWRCSRYNSGIVLAQKNNRSLWRNRTDVDCSLKTAE